MDHSLADPTGPVQMPAAAAIDMLASPGLDAVFMRPGRIGVPSAWYGHVPFAHWLVAATAPRTVVELGTHTGVSYAALCEAVALTAVAARCTAVDTWQGDEHAGFYGDEVYNEWRTFHDPRYAAFSSLMRCTFDEARPFFANGSLDLLHIDGLHTYEAVRHDWLNWRPALSARAVVLFHDVNERQSDFGVWKLWEELRETYPSFTFHHGHGLGVLAVGDAVAPPVRQLCTLEAVSAAASRIRDRFAQLGERWESHAEQTGAIQHQRFAEGRIAGLEAEATAAAGVATSRIAVAEHDAALARHDAGLVRQANAALEAEAQTLHAKADAAAGQLASQEEALLDLRVARDSAWSHQAWLEDELRRRDGDLAQAHADLAERAESWERVHRVLAARDEALDTTRAQIAAMVRSTGWRMTAPLRQFGRTVPVVPAAARRVAGLTRMAASGELVRRRALRRQRAADIAALANCPLFDPVYYQARHPELATAGHSPAAHYAWVGAWSGAMPNPYFDSGWYLSRHPEAAASGQNPLLYWQHTGAAAGHDPNPFLDAAWYAERNPDARADPLLHFMQVGAKANLDPNPMLDAEAYLLEHAHARQSGMDALQHWWVFGAGTGLNPHPLFDAGWYRAQNGLPPDTDVLAHWLTLGRAAGLPTSPLTKRSDGLQPVAFPPVSDPAVTVIIPAYGHYADTIRTLYSLATGGGDPFDVVVVDDNPALRIAPLLERRVTGVRVLQNPTNLGYLRSCNSAAKQVTGRILVVLNNDTAVHPGWLAPLVDVLDQRSDVGMVGCKLLNTDGTVQEAGGTIASNGWGVPYGAGGDPALPEYNFVREVDVVVGACFAVKREAWDAIGGFDDAYAPAFYEEFDLAFTLRSYGWRVLYQPASVVDHLGSNSYGAVIRDRQSAKNHALFSQKWAAKLVEQPPANATPIRLRQRPHDAKVVLFIDDRVPEWDRHAGALTNRHYIQLWQQLGYHVVFAPMIVTAPLQPYTRQLQQEGVEIVHAPSTLEAWLRRHGREVDVIWTARPDVTGPLLAILRALCDAPILYYPHDLHHARERKRWELEGDPQALRESKRLELLENRIFGAVDCVLSISEAEARAMRAAVPTATIQSIPPYIYPPPPPAPDAAAFAGRDVILFVGGYAHPPNVDAARFLAMDIMPLVWRDEPSVRLVLAGSAPPPELRGLAQPMVEVPGFLADLAPLNRRARISVSPLRYGAGVKGKVVAALWEGLPVVSTPIGAEGLDLVDGVSASVATSPQDLADRIVALWRDPAQCAALGRAGQAVVSRHFAPATATECIANALIAARRRAARTGKVAADPSGVHA